MAEQPVLSPLAAAAAAGGGKSEDGTIGSGITAAWSACMDDWLADVPE